MLPLNKELTLNELEKLVAAAVFMGEDVDEDEAEDDDGEYVDLCDMIF